MRRPPRTSRRRTKGERQPQPQPWNVIEHSPDYGATWNEIEVHERAPLRTYLGPKREFEVYDDGKGNLYRWHTRQ